MRNSSKLFFCGLAVSAFLISNTSSAQNTTPGAKPKPTTTTNTTSSSNNSTPQKTGKTPEQRADSKTNWMKTNLTLSDDQVTKVKEAFVEYYTSMDNANKSTADEETKKQQKKDALKVREDKLKQILSKEQYAKLEEIRNANNTKTNGTTNKKPDDNSDAPAGGK